MTRGARRVYQTAAFTVRPMADGGEGSLDALLTARGGRAQAVAVTHPLGATVNATYGRFNDGGACIESALASGLQLLGASERDALAATSLGTGELIAAALADGADSIIVAIGGTASSDGGTGAARALGWRFLDLHGNDLPLGGGALVDLARIDGANATRPTVPIVAACDVDSPLLGPVGAARRFAPQKGATSDDVEVLESALANLARRIADDVGREVAPLSGAGAGGGLGTGLAAFFGATLRPGFELIAEVARLADDIRAADLVITGEGRLDDQSLAGKVPIGVARLAKAARVPCVAIAGELSADRAALREAGIEAALGIVQSGGSDKNERNPAGALEDATALNRGDDIARELEAMSSHSEVEAELARRLGVSGIDEKESRGRPRVGPVAGSE